LKVLPAPHNLPGTDPSFHQSRNYLSPSKHGGKEILASFGSCKEDGCGYRCGWTSNKARDLAMWKHRAFKVVEARIPYFKKIAQGDTQKVSELLRQTADKNTHLYPFWLKEVEGFFFNLAGDDAGLVLPEYNFQVEYDLGNGAYDVAKAALDKAYN
jgi:hypothetical protein